MSAKQPSLPPANRSGKGTGEDGKSAQLQPKPPASKQNPNK
jgi:hypothetical protein